MKKIQKRAHSGFSFGETLLAAFVLSVGLLGVVKLFQVSASQSFALREAVIASELAQEGIELVRNVRDNNFASGGDGFDSFSSNRHCYIDANDVALNCFANQGDTSRYTLAYSGGLYVATTGSGKFRRYIYIAFNDGSNPSANVKSFVVWNGASLPPASGSTTNCSLANKCAYTETTLTNWKN